MTPPPIPPRTSTGHQTGARRKGEPSKLDATPDAEEPVPFSINPFERRGLARTPPGQSGPSRGVARTPPGQLGPSRGVAPRGTTRSIRANEERPLRRKEEEDRRDQDRTPDRFKDKPEETKKSDPVNTRKRKDSQVEVVQKHKRGSKTHKEAAQPTTVKAWYGVPNYLQERPPGEDEASI